jgi:tyrosine-protein phosphatase SIW14
MHRFTVARRASGFVLLIALAVATLAGAGASQQSAKDHKTNEGILLPTSQIIKFGEVTPTLFRGGQPNAEGLSALKKMGIAVVVDMRSGDRDAEKEAVTKLGMEYVHISWHCPFPSDEPFAKFLKVVEDNPGKKVFVHCRLGDDRTGMAVAAYRMAEQGWSADRAMKEMHDFGFRGVHHMICPGLAPYEKSFPKRLEKSSVFRDLKRNGAPEKETSQEK